MRNGRDALLELNRASPAMALMGLSAFTCRESKANKRCCFCIVVDLQPNNFFPVRDLWSQGRAAASLSMHAMPGNRVR
jgi:hypothetical protein